MPTIYHYLDEKGRDLYQAWLDGLSDPLAKKQILKRILRLEVGLLGDCKPCRDGVWELRIDVGAGYRVYYAQAGKTIVLLLCGGDKRTQTADIDRAVAYWLDYQRRTSS